MFEQIDLFWVLTVFVTGWAGYRLAERYRLQPLAGFALGVAINTVLVADVGVFGQDLPHQGGALVISICFSFFVLLLLFVLAGTQKALSVLKVALIVTVISAGFSQIPRLGATTPTGRASNGSLPEGVSPTTISRTLLPRGVLAALDSPMMTVEMVARVGTATPLYHQASSNPAVGRRQIRRGDWVLVRRTVADDNGREWVEVLVSDAEGIFDERRGEVGYLPAGTLSFHVPVPAVTD